MRALTWQANGKVEVETVERPTIEEAGDAIIRVTSAAICGSDLHLYSVFGPFLRKGDILGHETMGIVEEVGSGVGAKGGEARRGSGLTPQCTFLLV